MATLIDHTHKSVTRGTPESLAGLMMTAAMQTPHARRLKGAGRTRYAELHVFAAIRRGGRTDVGQELRMTEDERATWEQAHPLSA